MTIEPWKVHTSRYLIQDRWMTLRADRCETSQGVVLDPYYVTESRDWVHVVAFDAQRRILLTRQYRHARRMICTELPCGMIDPGEQPAEAMRRELLEETGAVVEEMHPLQALASNPARDTNTVYPFVATGTRIVQEQNLDPSEQIEFVFAEVDDIFGMVERGEFVQGLQLGTLFLALRHMNKLTLDATHRR